jgi:hypothetical protein
MSACGQVYFIHLKEKLILAGQCFFSDTLVSAISKADWTDIYRITAIMKAKIYIITNMVLL